MKRLLLYIAIATVAWGVSEKELPGGLVANGDGSSDRGSWPGHRQGGGTRFAPFSKVLQLAKTMPNLNAVVSKLNQNSPTPRHWSQFGQLAQKDISRLS